MYFAIDEESDVPVLFAAKSAVYIPSSKSSSDNCSSIIKEFKYSSISESISKSALDSSLFNEFKYSSK